MSSSPLHPIPNRQLPYNDARRAALASNQNPNRTSQGDKKDKEVVDDGGWTVDKDQSVYVSKMRKQRARRMDLGVSTFSALHWIWLFG